MMNWNSKLRMRHRNYIECHHSHTKMILLMFGLSVTRKAIFMLSTSIFESVHSSYILSVFQVTFCFSFVLFISHRRTYGFHFMSFVKVTEHSPKVWVWGLEKHVWPCLVKQDTPGSRCLLFVNFVIFFSLLQPWPESSCSCPSAKVVKINLCYVREERLL